MAMPGGIIHLGPAEESQRSKLSSSTRAFSGSPATFRYSGRQQPASFDIVADAETRHRRAAREKGPMEEPRLSFRSAASLAPLADLFAAPNERDCARARSNVTVTARDVG